MALSRKKAVAFAFSAVIIVGATLAIGWYLRQAALNPYTDDASMGTRLDLDRAAARKR